MADIGDKIRLYFRGSGKAGDDDVVHPGENSLFDYAAGLLNDRAKHEIEEHLAACPRCLDLAMHIQEHLLAPDASEPGDAFERRKATIDKSVSVQEVGEVVFGLATRITQIMRTTGSPTPDLLSASRGLDTVTFDAKGSVELQLGDYLVIIDVIRHPNGQDVDVVLTNIAEKALVEGAEVILQHRDKHETTLTENGEASFPDVPAGRHLLRITDKEKRVGSIVLELRELNNRECVAEARAALLQGGYSRAEDFLATALVRDAEDREALQLMGVVQCLRVIDPEGFQSDLATRGPEAEAELPIERALTDLENLLIKMRDENPILAQVIEGVLHLNQQEKDAALQLFEGLSQELADFYLGYAGIAFAMQSDRKLEELPQAELDKVIRNLEKALALKPDDANIQEHHQRALKAKERQLQPGVSGDLMHRTLVDMSRDLAFLVKRTVTIQDRLGTLESRVNLCLSKLDEIQAQHRVADIASLSEDDLHDSSNEYNQALAGRVKEFKELVWEDYRETKARLIQELGGQELWSRLGVCGLYLLSGEFVFQLLNKAHADDYSAAGLGFFKAVERYLNDRIFWNVEAWLGCRCGDTDCIHEKLKEDFVKQKKGRVSLKILQDKPHYFILAGEHTLSCSEMADTFRDMQVLHQEWRVYELLLKFLSERSDHFLEKKFQKFLRRVSKYRNGAMHTEPLSFEDADQCRKLIMSELKLLVTLI